VTLVPASAWAPLRHRAFRALWIAQFASNTGTWMHLVGAQWLMGDLGGGALQVALVQTATTLPIFLAVLPAGALGDIVDRRLVLLVSQGAMLLVAGLLCALTLGGLTSPAVLLVLTFALGLGQALTIPCWQAIQPELVGLGEVPQAATLNGVNFNVARAVGPAIGGALIAATGPGLVFALNAASFLAIVGVLLAWRRPRARRAFAAEHPWSALAAGARFVRSSPSLRAVLARAGLFMTFASGLWALLPVVARGPLGLGPDGYGLLLGSVGIGAVAGAFVLPALRARLTVDRLVALASAAYAAALLAIGLSGTLPVVVGALVVSGLAWIGVLSSLSAAAQTLLPDWTRARGLAYYTLVFMGAQALGSVAWGVVAAEAGLDAALLVLAAGLLAGLVVARRFPLRATPLDVRPAQHLSEPHLVLDARPGDGPVLVCVEWRVAPDAAPAFLDAMRAVERSRRRTGARRWGLFQDGDDPAAYLEAFTVATWEEHRRQHEERRTRTDEEVVQRARELALDGGEPRVRHLLSAYRDGARERPGAQTSTTTGSTIGRLRRRS
jgi:MFS family permease